MSQFNQQVYEKALEEAKSYAKRFSEPMFIIRFNFSGKIETIFSDVLADSFEHIGELSTIIASVSKRGKVTESRWVKQQMGVAA